MRFWIVKPWQSSWVGGTVAAAALALGVPLFLRMPPWTDVTLHDMATRNILRGGVHYRDVFDTNLPGIDWVMAAIRATCGWSYEALRVWDLLIVAGCVAILASLAKRSNASNAAIAWLAAAVALWYPFTSEFNHCQRDVWMLLPAVAATRLRSLPEPRMRDGLYEGILWGIAVWFKPHVLIPAAAVWLVSQRFTSGRRGRDLGSIVLGGSLAGAIGVAWLAVTGAWPYFVDIFTRWNPEYVSAGIWQTLPFKVSYLVQCFWPWGLVHLAAIPMALSAMRSRESAARSLLAALYLGWLVQAVLLQKPFDYVQVPVLLLAFAVVASRGWSSGFPFLLWFLTLGFPTQALELWPLCWQSEEQPALRDRLGHFTDTPWGTNWSDLGEVEAYLGTVQPPLADRELTCWHDSTHPLYLKLGIEPSTRYMHFCTVFPLRGKLSEIRGDLIRSPQRYVVSDLMRMTRNPARAGEGGSGLPEWLPSRERERFPWNQPVVFRSGRYVVHRIVRPPLPEEIDITAWNELTE